MLFDPKSAGDAIKAKAHAQRKRAVADLMEPTDWTGARFERIEAKKMDAAADAFLTLPEQPEIGLGGEIVPAGKDADALPGIVDTVRDSPDYLNAKASCDRLDLVANAAGLTLPIDAAQTIGAKNSLEKMLAHQLAAAHVAAMQLLSEASNERHRMHNTSGKYHDAASVETCRLTNAAARMMAAFNESLLTLQRIRSGGRQVVTVQHVQVGEGGQAIVAGSIKTGGKRRWAKRK